MLIAAWIGFALTVGLVLLLALCLVCYFLYVITDGLHNWGMMVILLGIVLFFGVLVWSSAYLEAYYKVKHQRMTNVEQR